MNEPPQGAPELAPADTRLFLPLLLLFVGSGCAALIYEIVWLQLLQLVVGSSAVSLGVLLGTFMGGMCLGSLLLPRLVSPRRHPLRVYALLECGLGLIGLAVLYALPEAVPLYTADAGTGLAGLLARGAVASVFLLPPTLLMGATLPAIARWVDSTPAGVSRLGFFYGGNIAGAVFGCLLAGFYLLRVRDMPTATYVAAAINGTVAFLALLMAWMAPAAPRDAQDWLFRPQMLAATGRSPDRARAASWDRVVLFVVVGLSGACALSAEVVWTRLLSLLLGPTVYTFSIILSVFLAALGLGSGAGAVLARTTGQGRSLLGLCQFLLAGAVAWSAHLLGRSLPYWPIDPLLATSAWANLQLDLMRCLWTVFPAAFLWGASFPLALAAAAAPGCDMGRTVGGVYAANTVGAIIGALGSSIGLIGWIGTQGTQRVIVGLSMLAALLAWATFGKPPFPESVSRRSSWYYVLAPPPGLIRVGALALAAGLAWLIPAVPGDLIAYGRFVPTRPKDAKILFRGEGMNASVAVSERAGGERNFHVSGKVEASTEPQDMRLQRMLGHLPALLHPAPRSVLIVGCGAGVTAGTFVLHPEVKRIVICEIEPLIPRVVARYFAWENYHVAEDPRVEIVYDDARNFVLTTHEKFDIITSDPIHPWVKGAATLYTREYFELCRQHLNPGGLITQWVPLYESNPAVVKSELATFFAAFPHGTIWANEVSGEGYDVVLLGPDQPMRIDVEGLQRRMDQKAYLPVTLSLDEVGLKSALDLLATYAGRAADLHPWLSDAQVNLDRNLRLQYLAGTGLNADFSTSIYDEILSYRAFPLDLFVGSGRVRESLRRRLGLAK